MIEQQTLAIPAMTAAVIKARLYETYNRQHNWLSFAELRIGTGYGKGAEQRIDFWAMHEYPSKGFQRIAFEIKVSRSDFLAEMKQPMKRRAALLISNEFYFITPPGLIKADELPIEAGLIEVQADGWLQTKHAAPFRDVAPPTWRFLAAVTRRALQGSSEDPHA